MLSQGLYEAGRAILAGDGDADCGTTGEINAREFGDLCDAFIYATPQTEHAHNSLILAIICNTGRDPPEPGLAAWVSATADKSSLSSSSKAAVTSDASEQRLKAEVMALPARERRRLKAVASDKAEEEAAARRNPYEEYYQAGRIKAPDPNAVTGAAGGMAKTNWDLEIRKRYLQPLSTETLEFPDTSSIHARMVPICYEESVAQGCSVQCAELVNIAAEAYLKTVLGEVFNRTRSNGPRYNHSAGEGIMTNSYKKKVAREEAELEAGTIQRTRDDNLLPIEAQTAFARRPIGMADLQLTAEAGPLPWNSNPLIGFSIATASAGYDYDQWLMEREPPKKLLTNGFAEPAGDPVDVDNTSDNYGWEGVGSHDRTRLQSVLADCLAAGV
jgi:transcriptional coactivator HFI1/ADA1